MLSCVRNIWMPTKARNVPNRVKIDNGRHEDNITMLNPLMRVSLAGGLVNQTTYPMVVPSATSAWTRCTLQCYYNATTHDVDGNANLRRTNVSNSLLTNRLNMARSCGGSRSPKIVAQIPLLLLVFTTLRNQNIDFSSDRRFSAASTVNLRLFCCKVSCGGTGSGMGAVTIPTTT